MPTNWGSRSFVAASSQHLDGSATVANTTSISAAFWMNPTATPAANATPFIIANTGVNARLLFSFPTSTSITVSINSQAGQSGPSGVTITFNTGTWYHFAFTSTASGSYFLYKNGTQISTA